MKSNVKKKMSDKIILSIGMIVKNEEKHLDKCLSALQKLRDNVSNELIIVDTGSTDRTKEIALKYTDKVYDFEWINDFSAARNCGLEKATGEWFMFIDADEYLDEKCDDMIKFFNMPEVNSQYNSASFIIRNYGANSKKTSSQFLAPRVVRNFEGLKFSDPIHEWIPQPKPHGFFDTIFHHYGYAYTSRAERDKKGERNLVPLLKEYEENPENLRVLYHLCDAIFEDKFFPTKEIKEKYLDEYLNLAKKDLKAPYALSAYIKYAVYYINYGKHKEAVDLLEEFVNVESGKDSVLMIVGYYYLAQTYMNLEDYENTYKAIEKYIEYYNRYQNNDLDLIDMRFTTVQGITEYNYEQMSVYASRCLNYLGRYDEAIEYMDGMILSEMTFPNLKLYLNILRDLLEQTHKYRCAVSCYEKLVDTGDNDKIGLMLFLMEQYYMEHPDEREDFIGEVVKYGTKGKYVELAGLIYDDMNGKDISIELSGFIESIERWNDGYAEAVYLAMKNNVDIKPAIKNMSHNVLKEILSLISDAHPYDYPGVALAYCEGFDFSSDIRCMFWCVSALEAAVNNSNELDDETRPVLFDFFVSLLSDYVCNVYNPELLNPEDVEVLPEIHRFGYFMTEAFDSKSSGDLIGYVRNMKEALRLCEPMKNVVSFYLSELEEEMRV